MEHKETAVAADDGAKAVETSSECDEQQLLDQDAGQSTSEAAVVVQSSTSASAASILGNVQSCVLDLLWS